MLISDVGPRDRLQNVARTMATAHKLAWIDALHAAGLREIEVSTFDASQGGLGGRPFAPSASGNVVTEDLLVMFEAMGVNTGIDLERLFQAPAAIQAGLPGEPIYGMAPEAGLTKGFVYADGRWPRPTPLPSGAEGART